MTLQDILNRYGYIAGLFDIDESEAQRIATHSETFEQFESIWANEDWWQSTEKESKGSNADWWQSTEGESEL